MDSHKKIKISSSYYAKMYNANFGFSTIICFGVMLIIVRPLKMCFSDSGDFKTYKSMKIFISKSGHQNMTSCTTHGLMKVKKNLKFNRILQSMH